jgi:ankyrin repeat protein
MRDVNGQTALMFAIKNRNIKRAKILLKANEGIRIKIKGLHITLL